MALWACGGGGTGTQPTQAPSSSAPVTYTTTLPTATVPPATTTLPTGARTKVAWRPPTDRQVIALIIDAGSDLGFTNSILDTLADSTLAALIGHTTRPYWRPPFGDHDTGVLDDVGAIGYAYTVMWTIDSLGWKGLSADQIVARVLDKAEPGAIIVMHAGSQSEDGPALGRVIDGLRAAGCRFTTVVNGLPV